MDFTDLGLSVVGAFYAFAGVVAARSGLMSRMLDKTIAAIGGERASAAETARALWMVCASIVILAGGVALMLRTGLAAWLFTISALAQGLYLGLIAPRYLDPADPPDAAGRKQTTNAFVIYLAATAFVLWAHATGRLVDWHMLPWPLVPVAVCAIGAFAGYALLTFFNPTAK